MTVYDHRRCELGEGPLWHPTRNQLFWFDILNNRMMSRDVAGQQEWRFGERVSAAGWVPIRFFGEPASASGPIEITG